MDKVQWLSFLGATVQNAQFVRQFLRACLSVCCVQTSNSSSPSQEHISWVTVTSSDRYVVAALQRASDDVAVFFVFDLFKDDNSSSAKTLTLDAFAQVSDHSIGLCLQFDEPSVRWLIQYGPSELHNTDIIAVQFCFVRLHILNNDSISLIITVNRVKGGHVETLGLCSSFTTQCSNSIKVR